MHKYSLGYIKDFLVKEGLKAEVATSENIVSKHIIIELEKDHKERDLKIYLTLDQEKVKKESHRKPALFLQIWMVFPFKFHDESILELARYLIIINKSLAFPGFGLSEPDQMIFYKYTLTFPNENLDLILIKNFIDLIQFLYDTYSQTIEQVAIKPTSPAVNI